MKLGIIGIKGCGYSERSYNFGVLACLDERCSKIIKVSQPQVRMVGVQFPGSFEESDSSIELPGPDVSLSQMYEGGRSVGVERHAEIEKAECLARVILS